MPENRGMTLPETGLKDRGLSAMALPSLYDGPCLCTRAGSPAYSVLRWRFVKPGAARVTAAVRPGVVVLATGAWYDPEAPGGLDRHGNPNVLTRDKGTSRLAQGPSAHSALVEVEKLVGAAPEVEAFEPPEIAAR